MGLVDFSVLIVADVIVLIVIWTRTSRHVKEASRLGINVNISATLLRYRRISCITFDPLADYDHEYRKVVFLVCIIKAD